MSDFWRKLESKIAQTSCPLVVGFDPVVEKMPEKFRGKDPAEGVPEYYSELFGVLRRYVCAVKPNVAFFLALGDDGIKILRNLVARIKESDPEMPIILDGKFNDIGHTAERYAEFSRFLGVDAVILNPYLGSDTLAPFVERELGIIVLGATSNPSYEEIEGLSVGGRPLYVVVAERVSEWSRRFGEKLGLVVGATHPAAIEQIRSAAPDIPFLMPGIGAQGGDLESAIKFGTTRDGFPPLIVSARYLTLNLGENYLSESESRAKQLCESIRKFLKG